VEHKENTYAVIKVVRQDGVEIPLLDSGGDPDDNGIGRNVHYSNFILQRVEDSRVERQILVETFGESFCYFFGERPRILNFQGVLLNTNDFNWKAEFWQNYEENFRGSRCVEQGTRVYMFYDDIVVEGYMLSAQSIDDANNPRMLPLNFQLFLTNYVNLSNVGSVFKGARFQTGSAPVTERFVSSTEEVRARNLQSQTAGGGGILGVLADTQQFVNNASFSIQNTLSIIKNTFYGRGIGVPQGIGNQLALPTIANKAVFDTQSGAQLLSDNFDEFVEREGPRARFDEIERDRVRGIMRLRTGEELERQARAELERRGIDTSPPSAASLLLGRLAFAGAQVFGSFGIRQAGGVVSNLL
jgi:hypothetical protein